MEGGLIAAKPNESPLFETFWKYQKTF